MNQIIEHCYIHIPFCLKKCSYCSFFSVIYNSATTEEYCGFIKKEIELIQSNWKIRPKTIYFGGGTPSLLSDKQLQSIIHSFDLSDIEEITIEINPIHLSEKYIDGILQTNINRISIGAQSFLDSELVLLGRLHRNVHTVNGVQLLRKKGASNISLDFIYGLPGQKLEEVEFSLEKMIEVNPEHVSLYCLSLEESVPLFKRKHEIPSDEEIAEMYKFIRYRLLKSDFIQYEISNFSKASYHSKHNLSYWTHKSYLGLGAGASGFVSNFRYQNHAHLEQYKAMILAAKIFPQRELLSRQTMEREFIFLQLRKTNGLSVSEFENRFEHSFSETYKRQIDFLIEQKLADFINDRFVLLPEAYFVSDEILSNFM